LVLPKGSLEQATLQLFEDADLAVVRSSDVDYRANIDDPRVIDVTIGVAIGVLVGDIFVHFFGSGVWQIAIVAMTPTFRQPSKRKMNAPCRVDGQWVTLERATGQRRTVWCGPDR